MLGSSSLVAVGDVRSKLKVAPVPSSSCSSSPKYHLPDSISGTHDLQLATLVQHEPQLTVERTRGHAVSVRLSIER